MKKHFLRIRAKKNKFIILILITLFAVGCVKIGEKNCFRPHDYETYEVYGERYYLCYYCL